MVSGSCYDLHVARLTSGTFTWSVHTRTKLPISNFKITMRVFPRGIPSVRRQSRPIERHPRRVCSKSNSSYIEDNRPLYIPTKDMVQTLFYVTSPNCSWNCAKEEANTEMNCIVHSKKDVYAVAQFYEKNVYIISPKKKKINRNSFVFYKNLIPLFFLTANKRYSFLLAVNCN